VANTVVVGSQWGDEGKAKVIDYLTERSDIIIRFQGGANAGHTVVVGEDKFVFHTVPSGIISPNKVCIISNGVVFDAEQFLGEIDDLQKKNISIENRLFISDIAHLVFPFHKTLDLAFEAYMKGNKIGTTGRGIGPAYADKINRIGIRTGDLLDWNNFTGKVTVAYNYKKFLIEKFYNFPFDCSLDELLARYDGIRTRIVPLIRDTGHYIFNALQQKKRLLFEGAQGTFLDIDHGTYPFVTSSNTISGCACTGSGIGPSAIDHVVGIVKAYTTRVGNGPFPTELNDSIGERLRAEGGEFGATTGRPRRCGWFDSVVVRKAVQLNGLTRIALMKLDVLNMFDEIQICTHYEINGKKVTDFPSVSLDVEKVVPVYESHQGWKSDISQCKKVSELPSLAMKYVKRIQEICYKVPLLMISVGPERNQTLEVEPI
jgi:adenylosuccinate synthase